MTQSLSQIARTAALAVALVGTALTITACATSGSPSFANAVNPHPELSGGVLTQSYTPVLANPTNPLAQTRSSLKVAEEPELK